MCGPSPLVKRNPSFTEMLPLPKVYKNRTVPHMNIVMLVVGSHGDVQPFVSIAKELIKYGHRVRIATHINFKKFVEDNGPEFYPLAGDPEKLMEYMVRTEGSILPGSIKEVVEDVPSKIQMIKEITHSTWGACTEPAPYPLAEPFHADVIIANPPSYGGPHCAEALQIPLHMMFTMPWTPTREFSHPLFSMGKSGGNIVSLGAINAASYYILEGLVWEGIGEVINAFRRKLHLPILNVTNGASTLLFKNTLPFTYLWSPSIVPKPIDWGDNVDVVGFCLLEGSGMGDWKPPETLVEFLAKGDKPIYIGFGSCVIVDPKTVSQKIFDALLKSGKRGIIQAGWAKLGEGLEIPDHVYMVGRAPHTWLFKQCAAVCHHGGAGTTATGLTLAVPTIICPFFGDQPFWGESVFRAGAGPYPLRIGPATVDELAEAFTFACRPDVAVAAQLMSEAMQKETGPFNAMCAFHAKLPVTEIQCDVNNLDVAKVYCEDCEMKMSFRCDEVVHRDPSRAKHARNRYHCVIDHASTHTETNIVSHMASAGEGLVKDIAHGIVAIVKDPVRGAKKGGIKGGLRGGGMGIGHFVTSTITGAMTFVDEIGSGLIATADTIKGEKTPLNEKLTARLNEIAPADWGKGSHVTTAEDGFKEGAKHFAHNMGTGLTDIFTLPVEGFRSGHTNSESIKGAAKGIGIGLSSLILRPAGGVLRALASPTLGGARQLRAAIEGTARKQSYHSLSLKLTDDEILNLYDQAIACRSVPVTPNSAVLKKSLSTFLGDGVNTDSSKGTGIAISDVAPVVHNHDNSGSPVTNNV